MPNFDERGNELVADALAPLVLARQTDYTRRGRTPGRKPQLIQLASLTASALVNGEPTGASSGSAGPPVHVGQFNECLLWAYVTGGTGSPAAVQFGMQLCDLYDGAYLLHPVGLSAASTKTSGILGVLAFNTLGVTLRAICVATTAYTGGTITIWGAFKV